MDLALIKLLKVDQRDLLYLTLSLVESAPALALLTTVEADLRSQYLKVLKTSEDVGCLRDFGGAEPRPNSASY